MRDFKDIKVAVAGTGYVGLSIATLLSQHHHVTAVDVIPEKVEKLNKINHSCWLYPQSLLKIRPERSKEVQPPFLSRVPS